MRSKCADLKLTPELRRILKRPLGKLIQDPALIPKSSWLVCVGDVVTESLWNLGINPKLCIIDGKSLRKPHRELIPPKDYRKTKVINPAGYITSQLRSKIRECLQSPGNHLLIVDGEEDLAALPAIEFCPEGSLVIYGQPRHGIVVVQVDSRIKSRIDRYYSRMEPTFISNHANAQGIDQISISSRQ